MKNELLSPQLPPSFAPGTGPRMLALAIGIGTSSLVTVMGAAMLIYGLAVYPPGEGQWAGFMGGGFGAFVGGLGGFLSCWNKLSTLRGKLDLMYDSRWNFLDGIFALYGLVGVAALVAVAIWWPTLNFGLRITALILGSIAMFQGVGFSAWRLAMRRTARLRQEPMLDLRMILIAAGMISCSVLLVIGAALIVVAAIRFPIARASFGAAWAPPSCFCLVEAGDCWGRGIRIVRWKACRTG